MCDDVPFFISEKIRKERRKMQCLMTYKWVKLLRSHLPEGKELMGYWEKLASHAAFRKGQALYCGHSLIGLSPGCGPAAWRGSSGFLDLRAVSLFLM